MTLVPHRTLLLVLATLLLTACSGWQLRGQTHTPQFESVTLAGGTAQLRYTLERELTPLGVLLHGESPYVIRVIDERWDRRTAAVDERGRIAELELHYELVWQLIDRDTQAPLNPPRHIRALRNLAYYPDNITASSDEEEMIRQDLYDDIVYRLINQLADASRKVQRN
ncbi:rare lipoprotein B [Alcanivorax xiamenensis]|uniref:LPS-assembly lipoprotein LptE n=1 Tax=Alcanivorax xiamenensis TaxID=1177156 RepID=A0ABQ6YBQ6_9GAMM|nr:MULTISPECIES: LPS assembly lipoprotein LptE [Alcanivorax]KAF0807432.1 rare lipoprotein B [Alcanivorax xiamenensis]